MESVLFCMRMFSCEFNKFWCMCWSRCGSLDVEHSMSFHRGPNLFGRVKEVLENGFRSSMNQTRELFAQTSTPWCVYWRRQRSVCGEHLGNSCGNMNFFIENQNQLNRPFFWERFGDCVQNGRG